MAKEAYPTYGKRGLSYGKRGLSYGNRGLSYGKRDLSYGKTDLSYGILNHISSRLGKVGLYPQEPTPAWKVK